MNSRPNVIILILDALRAGNMSAYGYNSNTTPNIDEFAASNILFRRAFTSATWTIPVHASLLSGLYLSQHRIENVKANRRFNSEITTMPKALRDNGYRTAAFSQNELFSPEHSFDFFDAFHVLQSKHDAPDQFAATREKRRLHTTIKRYRQKMATTRQLFDEMLQWITSNDDTPLLAVSNCTTAHYSWAVPFGILVPELGLNLRRLTNSEFYDPRPFDYNTGLRAITAKHRETWLSLYDAAIKFVDREIGRFLKKLRQWAGFTNTILVITSDHGEMLGDGRDIFGHTLTLHDNILHVPLIVQHPDHLSPKRVEGVVQTLDLYPSILEWCNIPLEDISPVQLQRPVLSNAISSESAAKGYAFAEEDYTDSYDVPGALLGLNPEMDPDKYPRQQIAIHSATHKYIWRSDNNHKLYDLVNDSNEAVNLIGDESQEGTLLALQEALELWRSELRPLPPIKLDRDITTDPEVYKRLKMLGYVG